jgi:DNA-directed RNA polymerase sigma subunit (sigma70/sigma32)
MGFTRERARQVESRAMPGLRHLIVPDEGGTDGC